MKQAQITSNNFLNRFLHVCSDIESIYIGNFVWCLFLLEIYTTIIPGHGNLIWIALSYQFVIQLKSHLKQADYFFALRINHCIYSIVCHTDQLINSANNYTGSICIYNK